MRESFEDYLRSANATDTSLPTSVVDLQKVAGVRLVIGDEKDPEYVGFVQWQSVVYIAGDLNNFLLLLDGFFVWMEKSMAQTVPFQVGIHPYLDSVEAGDVWDDLEYKEYSYNEPTKDLPLKIFEAAPPYGKRIVALQMEVESTDNVSLVFSGRLYEHRDRFIAKGIGGGFPSECDDKGKYCRVMKSVDVSDEAEMEKVFRMSFAYQICPK